MSGPMTVITSEQGKRGGHPGGQRYASELINRAYSRGLHVAELDIVTYATEATLFEPARPDVWRITFTRRAEP